MLEASIQNLTFEIIDQISISDIIYAEISESGAMGNAGGLIFYTVRNGSFNQYETSIFQDEGLYTKFEELIFQHQNQFKSEVKPSKDLFFDYHYGGMGNHIFIKKESDIKFGKNFLIFKIAERSYQIHPSVLGVHLRLAHSLQNNTNEKRKLTKAKTPWLSWSRFRSFILSLKSRSS